MQDVMGTSIPFFSDVYGRNRKSAASLKACLLMPNRTLAYGVPTQTFLDYFQMSKYFGRRACREFDTAIKQCFMDEFLCIPTTADIKTTVKLHKSQHTLMECLGPLIAPILTGKTVQRLGMEHLEGKTIMQFVVSIHFLECFLWVPRNIEWPQYTQPVSIQIQSYKWKI